MYKIFLTVLIFVFTTSSVFSAGSSGGDSGGGEAKPVSQYEIAVKMINKAKKFEKKNKSDKAQKHYKRYTILWDLNWILSM